MLRNPFTLAIILAIGLVLNHILGFKPSPYYRVTYVAPLIGPALTTLPVLATIEYLQRWPFLARMRQVVGSIDVLDLPAFYGSSAWVFEHNGEVRGFVALDSTRAGEAIQSVLGGSDGEVATPGSVDVTKVSTTPAASKSSSSSLSGSAKASTDSSTAEIRHLTVDAPLRKFGIGTELVAAALDAAFSPTSSTQRVVVLTSPYTPGGERVFTKCGFAGIEADKAWREPEPLGLLKLKGRWLGVSRDVWAKKRGEIFAASAAGGKG